MLEVDSVAISFFDKKVLSGCYLSCKKGEIVGFLGRNGSGKSTLLKIIFGELKADFKHLRIDGKITNTGYRSGKLAYLSQDNFLPPFLKVEELLRNSFADTDVLKNPLVEKLFGQRIRDLSGGEQRFVECLWILSRPVKFILLDEPFSGVSPLQIELLQRLIHHEAKNKGIILTDHLYRPLMEISDRIVLLHNNSVYQINHENDLIRYSYIPTSL